MPFTPSHAVIALPFLRTPLIPAAIAVGAMTPDLPLFVRQVVPSYSTTHDLTAIVLTGGIALVLLLLWRCVMRPAAVHLLPGFIAERLPAAWQQNTRATMRETFVGSPGPVTASGTMKQVGWLLLSLAIGIVSHVVWDSFTHEGRQHYAWLDAAWGPLPAFKWLQHASSALGLGILTIWGVRWLARQRRASINRLLPAWLRTLWVVALPASLIVATVWGFIAYGPLTSEWTIAHLAYRVLPPACAVWALFTLALCLGVLARTRRQPVRATGAPQS
ncbi:DUF4184 family protein [Microbacterium sp. NC79]|uniref:DUF4184 family protein n=1 Tax=Microbacterium sp. NC79 TaxID=2851009 RepID=UPI001C2B8AD1|nr:DUF4184 family protein [Microbacterium sp. NC79]